jgi:hypothetical protein
MFDYSFYIKKINKLHFLNQQIMRKMANPITTSGLFYSSIFFLIIQVRNNMSIFILENAAKSPFPINDLPNKIIAKILDNLCYKDLCATKQVSKRFNELAEMSWMSKKSISFDRISLFGKKSQRSDSKLTTVDKNRLLDSLSTTNPTSLTLFEMNDEKNNHAFVRFIESNGAAGLNELKLTGSFFTDKAIEAVANNCQQLERLSVIDAHKLTGSCFSKFSSNLTAVNILQCENILNNNYLTLFDKCKSLTRLGISIGETATAKCMETIVQRLPMLEVLHIELMNKSEDEDYQEEIVLSDIQLVCSLSNLRELELKNIRLTDQQVARILNECTQLKRFQLFDYRDMLILSAKAFTALPILAPLECIALKTDACFVRNDVLTVIKEQCADTLKRLELDDNRCVGNQSLINLLTSCKRLNYLGLARTNCDNEFLEEVLDLGREVYVDCRGSHVNVLEFLESNSLSLGMLKEAGDKSCGYEIRVGNLTIKICMSMFVPLPDGQIVQLTESQLDRVASCLNALKDV